MTTLLELIRRSVRDVGIEAPHPQICVVAPSNGSHGFLKRRLLAENGDGFLRIRFTEPDILVRQIGEPALIRAGRQPEPPGWLEATVARAVAGPAFETIPGLPIEYVERIRQPGWLASLAKAVERLEGAGVRAEQLERVEHDHDLPLRQLLAALLRSVEVARAADRVYGFGAIGDSALEVVRARQVPRMVAADEVIVAYGDRTLAPRAFDALRAWFGARPGLRLAFSPHEAAPASETGLRIAAKSYRVVDGHSDAKPVLARSQRCLFADEREGIESAGEVTTEVRFIRALDEVREVREVVRVVLEALRDGAPLDGVAIALTSTSRSAALQRELEAARVPASIIAGPPLASAGAARALLGAFELNGASVSPEALHQLLQHPRVRPVGPGGLPLKTRARWRRLLTRIGSVRGFGAIVTGLKAARAAAVAEDPDHRDRRAMDDLLTVIGRLEEDVKLPAEGHWSTYQARFRAFARAWLRNGPASRRIVELLEGRAASVGAPLDATLALELLRARLEREPLTRGSVGEPAVRVVPPLALVGSRFHTVIVSGLTDTEFPAPPKGDTILSDDLVAALNAQFGARLESSVIGDDLERRRLAAIVGAAYQRLVFTIPRSQLMDGRELQPSPYLSELTAALGRGRGPDAVAAFTSDAKVNAVGTTVDPSEAVNEVEFELAQLSQDPRAAVSSLTARAMPRGLLAAAVARDRVRASLATEEPVLLDEHTGFIPPALIHDELFQIASSSRALRELIEEPMKYFFRRVLGAWPPRQFPTPTDPWSVKAAARLLSSAAESVDPNSARWSDGFDEALEVAKAAAAETIDADLHDVLAATLAATRTEWSAALETVQRVSSPAAEVARDDDLPWKLKPEPSLVDGDGAVIVPWLRTDKPPNKKTKLDEVIGPALRALALFRSGVDITTIRPVHPDRPQTDGRPEALEEVRQLLAAATDQLGRGLWPASEVEPRSAPCYLLTSEPAIDAERRASLRGGSE